MAQKFATTLALLIVMSWSAAAQDLKATLSNAARAMGVTNLRTIEFSGSGSQFAMGQALHPGVPWPRFNAKTYDYTIDYITPAARQEMVRTQALNPPLGGSPQPIIGEQRQVQFVSGKFGWDLNGNDSRPIPEPTGNGVVLDPVGDRLVQIWLTPPGFIKAAMKSKDATAKQQVIGGKRFYVVSFGTGKTKMNGYIDDQNLVEKVETWIDNPVVGDMKVEAAYSQYRDFGGVKFPARIVQKQDDFPVLDLTITNVKPNVEFNIPVPDVVRQTPPPPAVNLKTEKVADGLYFFTGQNDNSIAVEFKDFVVIVEAPMSDARSLAVIAETKRLIPNKPIRYMVNTHTHFDHSGGIRTYAAEGITIITQEGNKAYIEQLLRAPHTIIPDTLAQMKIKPHFRVEGVDDSRVIADGSRKLILYHLQGNTHCDAMLMLYMPAEKIIMEADVFTKNLAPNIPQVLPSGAPPDYPRCCDARNFYANVVRLKLDVDTIVPIHNGVVSWDYFLKYLGKPAKENNGA